MVFPSCSLQGVVPTSSGIFAHSSWQICSRFLGLVGWMLFVDGNFQTVPQILKGTRIWILTWPHSPFLDFNRSCTDLTLCLGPLSSWKVKFLINVGIFLADRSRVSCNIPYCSVIFAPAFNFVKKPRLMLLWMALLD